MSKELLDTSELRKRFYCCSNNSILNENFQGQLISAGLMGNLPSYKGGILCIDGRGLF